MDIAWPAWEDVMLQSGGRSVGVWPTPTSKNTATLSFARTERRQRRYKSTALGEQARCASGSALLHRQMQRLAGTELNSSPHCGLVSERRACGAEDTPMTMRPNGHRAPQRLYFGPDVNENWLIFGLVAGRQSSVGVPVIYCPDCWLDEACALSFEAYIVRMPVLRDAAHKSTVVEMSALTDSSASIIRSEKSEHHTNISAQKQ